jgi:hypothetical protein
MALARVIERRRARPNIWNSISNVALLDGMENLVLDEVAFSVYLKDT